LRPSALLISERNLCCVEVEVRALVFAKGCRIPLQIIVDQHQGLGITAPEAQATPTPVIRLIELAVANLQFNQPLPQHRLTLVETRSVWLLSRLRTPRRRRWREHSGCGDEPGRNGPDTWSSEYAETWMRVSRHDMGR
jgi:hypothetical protein